MKTGRYKARSIIRRMSEIGLSPSKTRYNKDCDLRRGAFQDTARFKAGNFGLPLCCPKIGSTTVAKQMMIVCWPGRIVDNQAG